MTWIKEPNTSLRNKNLSESNKIINRLDQAKEFPDLRVMN